MDRKPQENACCEHAKPSGGLMAVSKPQKEHSLRMRTGALWFDGRDIEIHVYHNVKSNIIMFQDKL